MSTDLRQSSFYGILDSSYVSDSDWIPKYRALAAGGANPIQLRTKNESAASLKQKLELVLEYRESEAARDLPRPSLVLPDEIELALEFEGIGIHLEDSTADPRIVREQLGPDRILGVSAITTERVDEALALGSEVISYFSVGVVFASPTKPELSPVGLELVRYTQLKGWELPYFCIGGITRENLDQVKRAGTQRVVCVSDVLEASDTEAAVKSIIDTLSQS